MGVCCDAKIQNYPDPDIEESNSLKELTDVMNSKSSKLSSEINVISNHLNNPNQSLEELHLSTFSQDDLKKRLNFLPKLKTIYDNVAYQLIVLNMKDEDDDLKELKKILQNIVSKYYINDDPKNELDIILDDLRQYSFKKIGEVNC